jgi:hypothetical protein
MQSQGKMQISWLIKRCLLRFFRNPSLSDENVIFSSFGTQNHEFVWTAEPFQTCFFRAEFLIVLGGGLILKSTC